MAVFLAGLWERTVLPMRSKSRADPIYYTGIVMIAVGTLVLLTYFVVRLERVRSAARTPFSPIPQAARPPGSVASSNRLLAYRLSSTGRTLLSRCSGWTSWPGREKDLRSFPFVMEKEPVPSVFTGR